MHSINRLKHSARAEWSIGTGGYLSNLEIREILATEDVQEYYTEEAGDILVYAGTEWV